MVATEACFLEEGAPEWSPEGAEGTYQTEGVKALQAEGWPEQRLGTLSVSGPREHLQVAGHSWAGSGRRGEEKYEDGGAAGLHPQTLTLV